jgi:hypothetical protein
MSRSRKSPARWVTSASPPVPGDCGSTVASLTIAPVASAEKLLAACPAAGALAEPLRRYEGAHEVTSDVALAIGVLLDRLAEADEPNSRALV